MFLATDIGNTNIVIAIHDGKEWIQKYRFESKEIHPELFYETSLRDLLLEWGISPEHISGAGLSSVVPELTEKIANAIASNIRFAPVVLGPKYFLDLDITIPKVYEIGSDLVSNAMAIETNYKKNSIIVDFGTALTFTVYKNGVGIEGVTICPGLKTIISTLSNSTALLPNIDIQMPKSAIGRSTSEAINAGVLFGFMGMVKELLTRIKAELEEDFQVIATGGLSTVIKELIPEFDVINKELTLDGIKIIAEKFTL